MCVCVAGYNDELHLSDEVIDRISFAPSSDHVRTRLPGSYPSCPSCFMLHCLDFIVVQRFEPFQCIPAEDVGFISVSMVNTWYICLYGKRMSDADCVL